MLTVRKKSKELNVQMDGKSIKILMSKFEILQNKKIDQELTIIGNIFDQLKKLWWYENLKKSAWQGISMIITQSLYIVLFLSLGNGIIS